MLHITKSLYLQLLWQRENILPGNGTSLSASHLVILICNSSAMPTSTAEGMPKNSQILMRNAKKSQILVRNAKKSQILVRIAKNQPNSHEK